MVAVTTGGEVQAQHCQAGRVDKVAKSEVDSVDATREREGGDAGYVPAKSEKYHVQRPRIKFEDR